VVAEEMGSVVQQLIVISCAIAFVRLKFYRLKSKRVTNVAMKK